MTPVIDDPMMAIIMTVVIVVWGSLWLFTLYLMHRDSMKILKEREERNKELTVKEE